MGTVRWWMTRSSSAAPTRAPEGRDVGPVPVVGSGRVARVLFAVLTVLALTSVAAACSDPPSDQRRLNTAMVGAPELLSSADSEAVSAIGVELVALSQPLEAWFADAEPRDELLERMTAAVERIDRRLTPERAPAVRTTFEPYVAAWERILDALERDDAADYDAAVTRIRELDDRRISRVVEAFGEDTARELLESEGVDPNR